MLLCQPTNTVATPVKTSGKSSSRSKPNRRRNARSARRQKPNALSVRVAESSSRAQAFIRPTIEVSRTRKVRKRQKKPAILPAHQHRNQSPTQPSLNPNPLRNPRNSPDSGGRFVVQRQAAGFSVFMSFAYGSPLNEFCPITCAWVLTPTGIGCLVDSYPGSLNSLSSTLFPAILMVAVPRTSPSPQR